MPTKTFEQMNKRWDNLSTEEMQRETLTRIVTLQVRQRVQGEILKRLESKIEGNGNPGLTVRVDRLEQTGRWAKWFFGAGIITVLGVFINSLFHN